MQRSWFILWFAACGGAAGGEAESEAEGESESEGEGATVSLRGNAFIFGGSRLEGATVRLVEAPTRTVVTAEDGAFAFDGLPVGGEATLALEAEGFAPIQTGTLPLGEADLERVTFQAVEDAMYAALAAILDVEPDPETCQLASTVTRVGRSLYDEGAHGEAGATVTIDPPLPAGSGPVYFNASVVPDRALTETSEDGGVVYTNVPAGRYVLAAHKEGVEFAPVIATCRAGFLVNASPPWGLQALE